MKKMELNQMEFVHGGAPKTAAGWIGCGIGVLGFGLAFAGLVVSTGGIGLYIAAASYVVAPTGAALGCLS